MWPRVSRKRLQLTDPVVEQTATLIVMASIKLVCRNSRWRRSPLTSRLLFLSCWRSPVRRRFGWWLGFGRRSLTGVCWEVLHLLAVLFLLRDLQSVGRTIAEVDHVPKVFIFHLIPVSMTLDVNTTKGVILLKHVLLIRFSCGCCLFFGLLVLSLFGCDGCRHGMSFELRA